MAAPQIPGRPSQQRGFDGNRTISAGGGVLHNLLPPVTQPFEQLYRKYADKGMFAPSLSPSSPFSFELGAYQVPQNMALLITDVRADIYRFGGVGGGDTTPVKPRSMSTCIGFSLLVGQQTKGNVSFELEPSPVVTAAQQAYPGTTGLPVQIQTPYGGLTTSFQGGSLADFAVAQANRYANAAGPGNALQPQRPTRYGAETMPFTIYAFSGDVVQVKSSIWRALPIPIAFVEYSYSGLLLAETDVREWFEAIKYPQKNLEGIR